MTAMGFPIVIVGSGGLPVTESLSGFGTPVSVSSNGFGVPVTIVSSGGMPVIGSGGATAALPLDGITTGIKAAFSTRKLLSSYAGPAMQVTRASDSTTSNIGFVANALDTASLATFCAGTTGSVSIWFDQSGGGFNMTPGTAPVIFASGAVNTINSKPAVSFSGSQVLSNATLSANPVNTLYQNAVISPASFTSNLAVTGPSGAGGLEWRIDASSGALDLIEASIVNLATSTNSLTVSTGAVVEAQYNSTTGAFSFFINRASGSTGSSGATLTAATLSLGGYVAGAEFFNGLIGEYIAYDLVGGIPSASQTSIENNQKTFWGTP